MTATPTPITRRRRFLDNRAVRRFMNNPLALIGLFMVVGLTAACFLGPLLLPFDELYIDLRARFAPPLTGAHIFGTDPLGRDIAARLFHAGQVSMAVGFLAMAISTVIGTVIGVVAGFRGGESNAAMPRPAAMAA